MLVGIQWSISASELCNPFASAQETSEALSSEHQLIRILLGSSWWRPHQLKSWFALPTLPSFRVTNLSLSHQVSTCWLLIHLLRTTLGSQVPRVSCISGSLVHILVPTDRGNLALNPHQGQSLSNLKDCLAWQPISPYGTCLTNVPLKRDSINQILNIRIIFKWSFATLKHILTLRYNVNIEVNRTPHRQ